MPVNMKWVTNSMYTADTRLVEYRDISLRLNCFGDILRRGWKNRSMKAGKNETVNMMTKGGGNQ